MIASSMIRAAACALMLGVSGTAMAQSNPTVAGQPDEVSESGGLEAIIVTARRKEENLQDVPQAVSAFSSETLLRAGVTKAEDLVRITPSLQFSRFVGNPAATSFGIRGQRTNDIRIHSDSAVIPYVAEVPQKLPFGLGITGFLDVQSVQVLRGPQGTLFGRNSTGGAILITPNTPTDQFEGNAKFTLGNYQKIEGQATVNVPIAEGVGFRAAFIAGQRDPWYKNRSGGQDFNGEKYHGGRASFKVESGDFTSTFYGDYLKFEGTGQPGKIVAVNPNGPVPSVLPVLTATLQANLASDFYSATTGVPTSSYARVWGVSNTTTLRVSDTVVLKNVVGYRNVAYNQYTDADQTALPIVDSFIPGDGRQFSEEFQVQYDKDNLHIIGGAFYFTEKGRDYNNGVSVAFFSPVVFDHHLKNDAKSLFLEGTVDVTPELHLTAGARYTWDKRYRNARNFDVSGGAQVCRIRDANGVRQPNASCFSEVTAKFKKPTFNLTAKYDLSPDQQVYASWRRGYRTGGVLLDPVLPLGNTPYAPETVDSYEAGYKAEYNLGGDAALRFNVAGYYSKYNNIQKNQNIVTLFGATPVLQTITVNAAKATIYGLELESTLALSKNVQFNGSYSYTHPKYDRYVIGGVDLSAQSFGFVPKHKLSGSALFSLPVGDDSINLAPSISYQSSQEIEENTGPGTHQKGYVLVNFRAEYELSNGLKLGVYVNNLTRQKFYVAGNNLYKTVGYTVAYPGEPRMFGVDLSARF